MPRARKVLNGFTAKEVCAISGVSKHMLEYLRRHEFLRPSHVGGDQTLRGRVRFYSYRDLVVAKLIQKLRESGVRLYLLKRAVQRMAADDFWKDGRDPIDGLNWVVSDGTTVLLRDQDGFLDDLTGSGQRSFAFVVSVSRLRDEVREEVPLEKREHFSMANSDLYYVDAKSGNGAHGRRS